MNLADYHTHTPLCKHAEGEPKAYIEAAIQANLAAYGISDHAPMAGGTYTEPFDDWRMLETQIPDYLEWIQQAKDQAGDRIPVKAGLECDWLPGCEAWTETLRGMHDWDYLIGSVHYIADKWDFDNPAWLGRWAKTDIEEAWKLYWEAYTDMADSGLFDILAHPDLIKKFGYFPAGDSSRFYEPAVDAIATSGSIIELNTAGWRKPCAEQYPHSEFLELARDAGIDLIISSDAHQPEEVGCDFDKAKKVAQAAGYEQTVLLTDNGREYLPLD